MDTEISALLIAVKDGIEATIAGVIDGARGWLQASTARSPGRFWAAFTDLDCLRGEWGDWDQELLASGAAGLVCRCGAHSVQTRMIHNRWIFVVLCDGPPVPGAEKVVEQAAQVLQGLLPSGAPPAPAELGIPLAWIRRRSTH